MATSKAGPIVRKYYANGNLESVGRYRGKKRHGPWRFYHRDGKLWSTGRFEDGEGVGAFKWYAANGKLRQSGSFRDGKQVGLWKRYYGGTTQLFDVGRYGPDGKKIGVWRVYDKKGKLKRETRHGVTRGRARA